MATLKWLPEALNDVERLYRFLNEQNPKAAMRAAETILQGAKLLKKSPRIGRPMPDEAKKRELFVAFGAGAYVLRYRLDAEVVIVIRVWHSREDR